MIGVDIIADSVAPHGIRLTSMKLVFPRFILPQLTRHRVFSLSVSSSRAIPTKRMIRDVEENPVYPSSWRYRKKGMQPAGEMSKEDRVFADYAWTDARDTAIDAARKLESIKCAKEVVNRILEPFSHVQVLVTGTDWKNFFNLRVHADSQEEMEMLATEMKRTMWKHDPVELKIGDWHTPFYEDGYIKYGDMDARESRSDAIHQSVARCARVSYWMYDGSETSLKSDKRLYAQLVKDGHYSPLEHVARADFSRYSKFRNFRGWEQWRAMVEIGSVEV